MVLLKRIELSTSPLPRECSTTELQQLTDALVENISRFKKWCPERDLNLRHKDFQSSALPTELSGHIIFMHLLGSALPLINQRGKTV
jgi:hypothetical protein